MKRIRKNNQTWRIDIYNEYKQMRSEGISNRDAVSIIAKSRLAPKHVTDYELQVEIDMIKSIVKAAYNSERFRNAKAKAINTKIDKENP